MAIMMDTEQVELLAGVSLPMIANAAFEREGDVTLSELTQVLLEIGGSCMQDMREQLTLAMADDTAAVACDDGL